MGAFFATVRRDVLLALRRKSEVLTAIFFFVIVVSLFPLGIGPEPALLKKIAPGVLWVAALLATLLGLPRLFAADHLDGTLEQMALSPSPLAVLIAGKIAAHWLLCGLPLVLLAPLLGLQFGLDVQTLGILGLSLLLGTPLLSLIGAMGAALTL
ncbi:MAG: heme exporter protein CcmB, partial [Rugosibacter sp.]